MSFKFNKPTNIVFCFILTCTQLQWMVFLSDLCISLRKTILCAIRPFRFVIQVKIHYCIKSV